MKERRKEREKERNRDLWGLDQTIWSLDCPPPDGFLLREKETCVSQCHSSLNTKLVIRIKAQRAPEEVFCSPLLSTNEHSPLSDRRTVLLYIFSGERQLPPTAALDTQPPTSSAHFKMFDRQQGGLRRSWVLLLWRSCLWIWTTSLNICDLHYLWL